jgi:hypothetical protein
VPTTLLQPNRHTRPNRKLAEFAEVQRSAVRDDWQGYVPDINPVLLGFGAAKEVNGLVSKGGHLTQDDGFARIDSANLPLDDKVPATAEPVVGLAQFTDSSGGLTRLSITNRRVYRLASGSWTPVNAAGPLDSSSSTAGDLVDWTFDPLNNRLVFTNDVDGVLTYSTAGPTYATLGVGALSTLVAASVETFADRVLFLNTVEGGSQFPWRIRYPTVGFAGTDPFAETGSGFIDLPEMESEGLRLLLIGDVLAVYFRRGVALVRRTFLSDLPFTVEPLSTSRGLLSRHSIVNIGSGVHFGLFNDGWFFLDSTGGWTEAGIATFEDRREHKWLRTFYDSLDWNNKDRVVCGYDPFNRWVRIAFPLTGGNGEPTEIWTYDIQNDRVWKDSYPNNVNIWGEFDDEVSAATTWDGATGTWDEQTQTWREMAANTGQRRVVHGTANGLVFRHDPGLFEKDGSVSAFDWQSHALDLGASSAIKVGDRLWLEYTRQTDTPVVSLSVGNQTTTQTSTITLNKGNSGTIQYDYAPFRVSGHRLDIGLAGNAPVEINSLQLNYLIEGTEALR